MISTRVKISNDGAETGALLQQYLQDRGVYNPRGPATVCYGLSTDRTPTINAACRSDKITRMQRMQAAGVNLVPWAVGSNAHNLRLPLYARKARGMGAKDLMPVFNSAEIDWRIHAGYDWFSSVVPILTEIRVWVWRGEPLDTYEKVMERPDEFTVMGRNHGAGFAYRHVSDIPIVTQQAIMASDAVGFDFGAVDLIIDPDNRPWVLEINSCPGVLRSKTEATLAKLADKITYDWCSKDCPAR